MSVASKVVIVIGDWVVDEYWFLVKHQSDISSHTGFTHYRIANKPDEYIRDLCGAGHIARLFYEMNADKDGKYEIYGIGIWHENDTSLIRDLIHAKKDKRCMAAKTCHAIINTICTDLPAIKLHTLDDAGPTVQVIRQYHKEDGGLVQVSRVDWEPHGDPAEKIHDGTTISGFLPDVNDPAIVVHDLNKGAISTKIIDYLTNTNAVNIVTH